jgi:hypothetical protein
VATAGSLKIGTLLLQAELVQESDLADSVQVAKRMKLPLGRVLIGTGFISDDVLNAALAAQSLIRDKILDHEIAIKALKAINERGIGFEEALREFGLHSENLEFTAKLGQLLVDSGMINLGQRNEALQTAFAAGLPIGRVLVLKSVLSPLSVYAALSAQVMIRADNITRDQAIDALKTVRISKCTFEMALKSAGYAKPKVANKIMLGELLIISDQITEVDFLTALESSLCNDHPLGTVLIESGLITKEKLDRTLEIQKKVTEGKMSSAAAAEYLQQDDGDGSGSPAKMPGKKIHGQADLSGPEKGAFGIAELLMLCKVITHRVANSAEAEAERTGSKFEDVLLARGVVEPNILETAIRCLSLHSMNTITSEEAILVFHAWLSKRDEVIDDVLSRIAQRDLG